MARDWLFRSEEGTCNFRCAGVIIRNGKVLLQRDGTEYALVGGHVQLGETGEEAVVREFQEELGVDIECKRMLWTEECFWEWRGKLTHTLSFYYLAEFCKDSDFPDDGCYHPQKENPRIEIGWIPINELNGLTVYPEFLKDQIMECKSGHFITRAQ
ncbi:MAG: NUDIX hydrolase [Clostridia bacterium]|nr:NUDIX hydrolase [Clostridia bacterium]